VKRLLLASAFAFAMSAGAMADTITSLGTNPTSGAGAFANTDPGTGAGGSGVFADIYKFDLVGAQILTIAFATNTFASGAPQFITNFQGAVVNDGPDNAPGGGDDSIVLGPELGAACNAIPNCQVFGGSAILGGGHYYLLISGNAGVDAGYGGNLSTNAETPLPGAIWMFGGALAAAFSLATHRKKKQKTAWDISPRAA
jgi:hypothetical protein